MSTISFIIILTNTIIMMMITRQFCFISNTDNLGATVDLGILGLCLSGNQEFIMEVTDKTRADVKGESLIQLILIFDFITCFLKGGTLIQLILVFDFIFSKILNLVSPPFHRNS